jgi:hypothetical protein
MLCAMSDLSTGLFTLGGALVGGAASYLASLKAVRWQFKHAAQVARYIRLDERNEQGLLALAAILAEVQPRVDRAYRLVESAPSLAPWPEIYVAADELRVRWNTDLAGKILNRSVVAKFADWDREIRQCTPTPEPPASPPESLPDEFVKQLGRSLARLGWLAIEVEDEVKRLPLAAGPSSRGRRIACGEGVTVFRPGLGVTDHPRVRGGPCVHLGHAERGTPGHPRGRGDHAVVKVHLSR